MNTIYGYVNFLSFTYKDPISEIINNLGDLEISSIKKEVCGSNRFR